MSVAPATSPDKPLAHVGHLPEFDLRRALFPSPQFDAVVEALRHEIEGKRIFKSGWLPGRDWKGTPYQAIFDAFRARMDHDAAYQNAGMFFGQLVQYVLIDDDEEWLFMPKDADELGGTTYFRRNY